MASDRLLWVVPDGRGDGWDVVRPGSGEITACSTTEERAVDEAEELLRATGGGIQVLDRERYIVSHRSVPPPPLSPRAAVRGLVVHLVVGAAAALLLGWWLHSLIPLGVVLGGCVGRLVSLRRLRRPARDGDTGSASSGSSPAAVDDSRSAVQADGRPSLCHPSRGELRDRTPR